MDDTRKVINEAEVSRRELAEVASRLTDLVDDLRALTTLLAQERQEGGPADG